MLSPKLRRYLEHDLAIHDRSLGGQELPGFGKLSIHLLDLKVDSQSINDGGEESEDCDSFRIHMRFSFAPNLSRDRFLGSPRVGILRTSIGKQHTHWLTL